MKLPFTALVAGIFLASACTITPVVADDNHRHNQEHGKAKFEFALIGDTPYGAAPGADFPAFDNVRNEINANPKIKWVLHVGDIKAGSSQCSDELFMDRFYRYNQFEMPFILTPGDNEWTDCHRANNGTYLPLERLAKLREVFYANPGRTLGEKPMYVDTQTNVPGYEEFPENVMWMEKGVMFSAMHIVGSKNALAPFATRTEQDDEEVGRRTNAALYWMEQTFQKAKEKQSPGVFVMIHANPGLEKDLNNVNRTGFMEFLAALEKHIVDFGKPVVLAHGDSHYFRVDSPALVEDNFVPNFTRVETFGSANIHWIRVKVDPNSDNVFTFVPEIVEENM